MMNRIEESWDNAWDNNHLKDVSKEYLKNRVDENLILKYLLMYGITKKFAKDTISGAKCEIRKDKLNELL